MRKSLFAKTLCGVLVGTAAFTACVDDKYDLGNLDSTIQVGKGGRFTLPSSDVDSIKLKNLFDINDGSAVEEHEDGSYYVNTSGNADPTTIKVNVIDIRKPNDQHFDATLDLRDVGGSVKANAPRRASGTTDYYYDISSIAKANIENAKATGISSDVISVEKLSFTPTTFSLTVNVTGSNIDVFDQMNFEQLLLHIPAGLGVSSCTYMGNELLTDALKATIRATGTLDISARMAELGISTAYTGFKTGDPIQFKLVIDQADVYTTTTSGITGTTFNPSAHTASLEGAIQLEGYVSIGAGDINPTLLQTRFTAIASSLTPTEAAAISADMAAGDYQSALAKVIPQIDFKGDGAFSSNLQVSNFSGKIQHIINKINPIELNDLPDFLTDDGVTLDLDNPQIFLMLKMMSPNDGVNKLFRQDITTNVQLDAYQNGVAAPTGHASTGDITFALSDNAKRLSYVEDGKNVDVMLTRVYSNAAIKDIPLPEDYVKMVFDHETPDFLSSFISHQQADGLGTLLTKVPNRVEVRGGSSDNIVVNVNCDAAELPLNTTINFEYKVYTPLTFGPTFSIVYTDSEDGWAEDMEDFEDIDIDAIEIAATVVSNKPVPMDMTITAKGIAADRSEISQLQVNTITIPANTTNRDITLTIKPQSGKKMRDFFRGSNGVKKLDGLKYVATMNNATKGQALNTNQYIQLKNVKITLVGGITVYDD